MKVPSSDTRQEAFRKKERNSGTGLRPKKGALVQQKLLLVMQGVRKSAMNSEGGQEGEERRIGGKTQSNSLALLRKDNQ